jgi:DNA-binding transcriptional LysR family regulator
MSVTVRHLKIFLCVYREKSITAAANRLHISQPAVSLSIRELEEHYGVKLFERFARRISVTPAGETLYHYANHIIASMDEAESVLKEWDGAGSLRLGSSVTVGAQLMPKLVVEYQRICPLVKLHITTSSSDQIEQKILDNEIDLAVIEGIVHSDMIVADNFMEDELGVFCGKSHPLSAKPDITLQELSKQALLLRESNSGTREYIQSFFELEGISIAPMWESTGTQTLVNAAALGLGVTILPVGLIGEFSNRKELVRLTLTGIELKRKFKIIRHKNKAPSLALQRFVELCKAHALYAEGGWKNDQNSGGNS